MFGIDIGYGYEMRFKDQLSLLISKRTVPVMFSLRRAALKLTQYGGRLIKYFNKRDIETRPYIIKIKSCLTFQAIFPLII